MIRGVLLLASVGFSGASMAVGSAGPTENLLLLAVLLALSGFFSSSETALFSLQPIDRETLKQQGDLGRLVVTLRARPRRLLATILMGNELVNITISALSAAFFERLLPGRGWVTIAVVTPLLVLFGEVIPKTLAFRFSRRISLLNIRPLYFLYYLFSPLRYLFSRAVELLARLFGVRAGNQARLEEEQFRTLVDEGTAQGTIRPVEQELIHAVFRFGDLPVSRVMTPRPDLVMLELRSPWEQILETVRSTGVSRIPIYVDDRDNIIGVLLAKDLLRFLGRPPPKTRQIQQLLHRVPFVPTTKRVDELLEELRTRKVHLALVVDEHGSIAGLVTLDDLLSELIGEVRDEAANDDPDDIRPDGPNGWLVRAGIDLDDFDERFETSLPRGEYTTLGGFILAELGALPERGRKVTWQDWRFEVTNIHRRRILEVRLERQGVAAPAEPETPMDQAPEVQES